jgi:hypothetical protein
VGLNAPFAMLVFSIAFVLRFVHLQQSSDIFIDEITYSRIAESVAQHHSVAFFGVPFFLHPPLVFFEQALFIDAFHIHGSVFAVVFALRTVSVLFAAGSAVFMLRLGTRVGGTAVGLVAAGLFAIDPFLIRFDSRVFLEPATLFWVLAGYSMLFNSLEGKGRSRTAYGIAAGCALALGALSNEMAIPLIVIPFAACLVFGFPFERLKLLTPSLAFVGVGAVFLETAVADGHLQTLISQQKNGLLRFIGASQQTGFNKPGAPSFVSRVLVHLGAFGAVYAVLGLAILPTVYFLWRGTPTLRFVALIGVSAYVIIAYQIVLGTLEEQMFYYVDVPAILLLAMGVVHLTRARRRTSRARSLRYAAVAVLAALVVFDAFTWVQIHTTPDDALVTAVTWVDTNVGAGTKIATLADTSQLLLNNYQVYVSPTKAQLQLERPAYVVTSSLQVEQGYGFASPTLVRWLTTHAYPVFSDTGRTFGTVLVWRLPYSASSNKPPGPPDINAVLPSQPVGQGDKAVVSQLQVRCCPVGPLDAAERSQYGLAK